ncbi:MAG: ATP-binding cassette domain-containing protein [Gemmataceae bacterium]|nr:ATP-binding cassette domain-containing protein [Gemmataceae bacterium]
MSPLEFAGSLRYPSGFQLEAAFAADAAVTALFGPSGSGKTSILSMIAGLRPPEQGRIRLGSRLLFDSSRGLNVKPEARRIGYVFQDHLLFPHLKVRRNLLYGWRRRPAAARPVDCARVVEILELGELLERQPHTLSGGQRQRVALGRALLCGPELLLLDEPLASVDVGLKSRVLDYLEQVLREWQIPTLYVTHDPDEVRRLAQKVVVLRDGRVCNEGLPATLL